MRNETVVWSVRITQEKKARVAKREDEERAGEERKRTVASSGTAFRIIYLISSSWVTSIFGNKYSQCVYYNYVVTEYDLIIESAGNIAMVSLISSRMSHVQRPPPPCGPVWWSL